MASALAVAVVVVPTTATVAADPPAHDLFADTTPIALDFTETIDTTMATTGEQQDFDAKHACGSPPFDSPPPHDATVWYSLQVAETVRVEVSAAPPEYVTPGFNVAVDTPDGLACVAGGPVELIFVAEPGPTYFIQVIDDQLPPDPDAPLDTVNGGTLAFSARCAAA